ncbi:hypothetical protein TWF506_000292 [Arthrobotrys conoides]|uniref:Uncharacterized protein n=1 Tax=Arthrobotrys conoides TaxID=74498 RepID=A0AAN8NDK9_9PEZI
MKTSLFTTIVVVVSSLLVTPALGLPVTNDLKGLEHKRRQEGGGLPDIWGCSSQVEGLLAMERWEGAAEKIFQEQKEYLAERRANLSHCAEFWEGSLEECVILGKESSGTLPEVYINHICQLLH